MTCIEINIRPVYDQLSVTVTPVNVGEVIMTAAARLEPVVITAVRADKEPVITAVPVCAGEDLVITAVPIRENMMLSFALVCTLAEYISCFAEGLWVNEAPWVNTEGWANNFN